MRVCTWVLRRRFNARCALLSVARQLPEMRAVFDRQQQEYDDVFRALSDLPAGASLPDALEGDVEPSRRVSDSVPAFRCVPCVPCVVSFLCSDETCAGGVRACAVWARCVGTATTATEASSSRGTCGALRAHGGSKRSVTACCAVLCAVHVD